MNEGKLRSNVKSQKELKPPVKHPLGVKKESQLNRDEELLQCLNCDNIFGELSLVTGYYYLDDGLLMSTEVCPRCGSCAYGWYEDKQE